jgi:hypothetical protein
MVRRGLRFDSIEGMWSMDEQRYEDMITDQVVDTMRAQWLQTEARRIKREDRERVVNRALGFACVVAAFVLVAIVIGVLR